jgi:inosose dehydratase
MKLAIAPINWTNDDLPELGGEIPFERCVAEMAEAGYKGCEVGTKFPKNAAVLKKKLEPLGLQVCNQWFGYRLTALSYSEVEKQFLEHLKFLQELGADIVGGAELGSKNIVNQAVPILGERDLFDAEDWKKTIKGLDQLGKIAAGEGFRLCYHTHMGMGVQTIQETKRLLEGTHPDFVFWNYDCGHFYFAGDDHLQALEQFAPRLGHVHLKDIRPHILEEVRAEKKSFLDAVKMGIFTVPGDSVIDFRPIIEKLKSISYSGWLVVEAEQDPAKANPLAYAKKSMNYLLNIIK